VSDRENLLPQVIGANFRRIRTEHGVTLGAVASHARRVGLRWNTAKVGDFERGRSRSPFGDVLAAVLALDNAIGAGPGPMATLRADGTVVSRQRPRVKLADLVQFDGFVSLTDDFAPVGSAIVAVCSGKTWELHGGDTAETADVDALLRLAPGPFGECGMRVCDVAGMRKRSDVTETRTARRLGISPDELLILTWRLFSGRTYSEERDRRCAGNPARRGPVSRELITELERTLTDGNR
jgi:transcriptional regulator with XRE-family HTH domain